MPEFLPFRNIRSHFSDTVVVDAHHPKVPALSHWRGAATFPEFHADTSTGIVLNALAADHPVTRRPYITNNHFDVDGFLGIWALFEPELALQHRVLLEEAAEIGDFREYDPARPQSDMALKLVAWINEAERQHFYRPFDARMEIRDCPPKYAYFLPQMCAFLADPDAFSSYWQPEYERVQADVQQLASQAGAILRIDALRLLVVRTSDPIHYYALFGQSRECDMVLSIYDHHRYELEYKYTTWVDTHRLSFPRIDLAPLADLLNAEETSEHSWTADRRMDSGPILRLAGDTLTKAERFDHPYLRPIHSSSWSPEHLFHAIDTYYANAYHNILPQCSRPSR